ncbi:MAG: GGDEF domain-containing protein [Candidatus Thiodiazotropha sp.]
MQRPSCFQLDAPHNAKEWHSTAIELLTSHDIPPSPVCHLIAYEYASRRSQELNQRLDKKLSAREHLDGYYLRQLFEDHYLDPEETDRIDDHLGDLHDLLFKVLQGVTSACSQTELFSETLMVQTQALGSNPSMEDLRIIANTLLEATSRAINNNHHMREQLHSVEAQTQSLRQEVSKLRDEVSTDPLTGLYNRKALNQRMNQLIEQTDADNDPRFSVLMLDIDHFKHFNDSYGHIIGDEVIRRVGSTMKELLRTSDFPARYGGEEFTVVLPATPIDDAMEIARRIHQAIGKLVLVRRSTKEKLPGITVSIGAAIFRGGDDRDSLLERADQALYLAKKGGRNRIMTETGISYM